MSTSTKPTQIHTAKQPISRRQAIIMLMITAVLWSSSGLFVKLINFAPLSILSARSLIASFVLLIYIRRPQRRYTKVQFVTAVSYMGTQFFFIAATKLTTAANAIFLQYTAPLYIILFGYWILRERPKRADWLTMPFIFGGMILFLYDGFSFSGLNGNIYAVISSITLAIMTLGMRLQKDGNPAQSIFLGNFIGILVGLPSLLQETLILTDVAIILYLGIFQIGISLIFYSMAIKQLEALETNLITTVEPILNPIWVFLILGEVPGWLALAGGLVVLTAVLTRATLSARTPP